MHRAIASTVLLMTALGASAQTVDPELLRTLRDTALRRAPADNAAIVTSVPERTDLVWIAHAERNGFRRVIQRTRGPQGWIAAVDAQLVHEPAHRGDPPVCAASLSECPARGCAEENSAEARANEMKRARPARGDAKTLSFDDFAQLQRIADESVGEGPDDLTPAQHAALHDLHVSTGMVAEGYAVRVIGYIGKGEDGLHVNKSGESVNCMLKKPQDNDIHIPVVEHAGEDEYHGIVAEMIPQERPATWTLQALQELQSKGAQLWIEGALVYDKVHYVNADPANPIEDEPARMSLWEIHPVTKFLVCHKDRCDPYNEAEWTPL